MTSAPTIPELKAIYQKAMTLNQTSRVAVLKEALAWYETAIPFFRHSFTSDEEQRFQRAMKARNLGHGGMTNDEAETAMRMSLKLMERCMERAGVPKVADAYAALEAARPQLEAEQRAAEARCERVIEALTAAYAHLGVRFKVDPSQSQPRCFDASGNISYTPDALESARLPGYAGLLPVVLGEMEPVLKATAVVRDSLGQPSINVSKMAANVKAAVTGLRSWLGANPLAAKDPQAVPVAAPISNPAPKPAPKPAAQRSTVNPYRGMKGQIFEALMAHNGTRTHMNTIMSGLAAKDPRRMLGHIAADGQLNGRWMLDLQRNGWLLFTM